MTYDAAWEPGRADTRWYEVIKMLKLRLTKRLVDDAREDRDRRCIVERDEDLDDVFVASEVSGIQGPNEREHTAT